MKEVLFFVMAFMCFGQTMKAKDILNDGLVAYYPLDGNANDISGNKNNGVEKGGVTYVTGILGQAAKFNGIDSYIKVGKVMEGLGDFTFSGWFLAPKEQGGYKRFSIYRENDLGWHGRGFQVGAARSPSNDKLYVSSSWSDATGYGMEDKCVAVQVSHFQEWNFVTVTRKADVLALYIRGELVSATKCGSVATQAKTNGILGCWFENNNAHQSGFSEGLLDEIRIYNRSLSISEINDLYFDSRLVAYYPLDGNAYDFSGNGNDGTQNEGVSYVDGALGQAASFDGVDGCIKVGKVMEGLKDFTFSAWFFVPGGLNGYKRFNIYRENDSGWNGSGFQVGAAKSPSNDKMYVSSSWSDATGYGMRDKGVAMEASHFQKWTFVTVTREGNVLMLYINGELLNTKICGKVATLAKANGILGCWFENGNAHQSGFTEGLLDEVRIYDKSLSIYEIKALHLDNNLIGY